MARNKARRKRGGSLKPAQLNLTYSLSNGISYIDLAHDLSKVNRRLYKQGKVYAVAGITFAFEPSPTTPQVVGMAVYTAGDTWVIQNAWTKGAAAWHKQQRRARSLIGQSAKPTWEDFKVYLDDAHRAGTIGDVLAGDGGAVGSGEWDYSRLLWEADDNSIDEVYLHLIGGDVSTTDWGLVLGYQDSRATVQSFDPELPSEFSSNMYAKLATDENLVVDEVADNMEVENDEPPYDHGNYPGSDTNSDAAWLQQISSASIGQPLGRCPGFQAECGLIRISLAGFNAVDPQFPVPATLVTIHLMPGNYQGVLAENMGQ